jgi:hypothetical protein
MTISRPLRNTNECPLLAHPGSRPNVCLSAVSRPSFRLRYFLV